VLLVRDVVVVLEAKTAAGGAAARRQVEEYALLLHYFHKASDRHRIVPVLLASTAVLVTDPVRQYEMFPQMAAYWISPVVESTWDEVGALLLEVGSGQAEQIDLAQWEASPYFPVPNILEAATALKSGL
jgi:hypothetical protein